jgi:hypothetical protein
MFSILDPVTRQALDPIEKLIDWEMFQSLVSELISPDIQIQSSNEADKTARVFAVSRASAYRIPSRKESIILGRKYEIPGLDYLLKYEGKVRKLWQQTRDPARKTAVNWVTRHIRRMVWKRLPGRWETKLANCKVTSQAIRPIAKSLSERGGPKAQSAIHGPLGPKLYPIDKANIIAGCLETSSVGMTCVTVTIDDTWRLKSKLCCLPSMKTSLLISDSVKFQKKYKP